MGRGRCTSVPAGEMSRAGVRSSEEFNLIDCHQDLPDERITSPLVLVPFLHAPCGRNFFTNGDRDASSNNRAAHFSSNVDILVPTDGAFPQSIDCSSVPPRRPSDGSRYGTDRARGSLRGHSRLRRLTLLLTPGVFRPVVVKLGIDSVAFDSSLMRIKQSACRFRSQIPDSDQQLPHVICRPH